MLLMNIEQIVNCAVLFFFSQTSFSNGFFAVPLGEDQRFSMKE